MKNKTEELEFKVKMKITDLKPGMVIGWVEDGFNECEGVVYNHEMVKGGSITFNSSPSYLMINKNIKYFKKETIQLEYK